MECPKNIDGIGKIGCSNPPIQPKSLTLMYNDEHSQRIRIAIKNCDYDYLKLMVDLTIVGIHANY